MDLDELLKRLDEAPATETKAENIENTVAETKDESLLPMGDSFTEYCKSHTRK